MCVKDNIILTPLVINIDLHSCTLKIENVFVSFGRILIELSLYIELVTTIVLYIKSLIHYVYIYVQIDRKNNNYYENQIFFIIS